MELKPALIDESIHAITAVSPKQNCRVPRSGVHIHSFAGCKGLDTIDPIHAAAILQLLPTKPRSRCG